MKCRICLTKKAVWIIPFMDRKDYTLKWRGTCDQCRDKLMKSKPNKKYRPMPLFAKRLRVEQ